MTRHHAILLCLWAFATALNLWKPFHIDDAAHVLITEHILTDPLHPMSGFLNWTDVSEPIFMTNQPHFFFYLMAAVMAVFGTSELPLHALEALFSLAAIFGAYWVFRLAQPRHALWLAAAVALSPGFIINQNVMVDMPVFALLAFALLWQMRDRPVASGLAFSAALLSKYTAIIAFPALAWAALRSRRMAVFIAVPIAALAAWSLFNIYDFGAMHMFERPTSSERGLFPSEKFILGLVAVSGAFSLPFAVAFLAAGRLRFMSAGLWAVGTFGWWYLWREEIASGENALLLLNAFLVGSAVPVWAWAGLYVLEFGWKALRHIRNLMEFTRENLLESTAAIWLVGGTYFLVTFPPFMATRHVLAILIPLILMGLRGVRLEQLPSRSAFVPVLAVTAAASAFAALNDHDFAAFYRTNAPVAAARAAELTGDGGNVYANGHWGWQVYAARAGMETFDTARTDLRPVDILVDAPLLSRQQVPELEFETLDRITQTMPFWRVLDTEVLYASGYTAFPLVGISEPQEIVLLQAKE